MSLCSLRNPGFQSSLHHISPRLWPACLPTAVERSRASKLPVFVAPMPKEEAG